MLAAVGPQAGATEPAFSLHPHGCFHTQPGMWCAQGHVPWRVTYISLSATAVAPEPPPPVRGPAHLKIQCRSQTMSDRQQPQGRQAALEGGAPRDPMVQSEPPPAPVLRGAAPCSHRWDSKQEAPTPTPRATGILVPSAPGSGWLGWQVRERLGGF